MIVFHTIKTRARAVALMALAPAILVGCGVHVVPQGVRTASAPPPQASTVAVPVPPPAPKPKPAPAALVATVHSLARNFDGIAGIAVESIDDGWQVSANGDRHMPQQSVSKMWVAMTILDLRDQGKLRFDEPITITKRDLTLFHQPVAGLLKDGHYSTTIGKLLHRALTTSDNTANDRLLWRAGGPEAVRAFIAKRHLGEIRFGPGERLLQSRTAGLTWHQKYSLGRNFYEARAALPTDVRRDAFNSYIADPPDGAAPKAVADALARLKKGELLSAGSTSWLITTMQESHTGPNRLRGAVPGGWLFGHKTGTGQDFGGRTAGYNDVGILTAPDGKSYSVAVMIGDTSRTIPQRWELMHAVVKSIVANHDG
ncbi:serine hydrolase [Stakelama saccharophila]|uniref:beta-lactamase n=1 Tax=Stakelama saccharophila TaxID=3075605 RepID=A0ABZ0BC18_9SPHN|nr:serine hydrolase [Stakelama sp. W311]WNO53844.1 serine hydrolase [Stakelama sp. W311]